MAILSSIAGGLLKGIFGDLFGTVKELGTQYIKKEISEAEFDAKVKQVTLDAQVQIEQSWAKASSEQFESFNASLRSSTVIQRAWAVTLITQLFVLFWYQWGASAFLLLTGKAWPGAGTTTEWAYLLLGGMLGLGPYVFNRGWKK